MSEQTDGDVLNANGKADETQTPAVSCPKPQEGDVDSATAKGSQKVAGSTLGEEGWVAVDSVNGTTVEATPPDPTVVDPTRPSDEQILPYENELRYCFWRAHLYGLVLLSCP